MTLSRTTALQFRHGRAGGYLRQYQLARAVMCTPVLDASVLSQPSGRERRVVDGRLRGHDEQTVGMAPFYLRKWGH